jgi:hypothetical protein
MPSSELTHEQRARRYIQASMKAGYTGLPAEHRQAYQDQMRSHERAYPRVREHALAGSDKDFDQPLAAGEREHQTHLREREGMQHADVLRTRNELRGTLGRAGHTATRARPAQRSAGARAAAATTSAASAGAGAVTAATRGNGSTFTYLIGVFLLLTLTYLLIAGKGVNAVSGIVNTIVGAFGAFIKPIDPLAAAEKALGANPIGYSEGPAAGETSIYTPIPGGTQAEKAEVLAISKTEGWGVDGALAWEHVIEDESGWNPTATNPTSGAFGIGQFLGATKTEYAPEGSESSNPVEQIKAMGDYIKNRYGNPLAALAHENTDHWY